MKVIVSPAKASITTANPAKLIEAMKARMSQKESKGKIKTWECDNEGDFRYLAQQYDGVAWVRPIVVVGRIDLKLLWPENAEPMQEIKGVFIGRFIEMVLGHFSSNDFSEARAIPLV